MAKSKSAQTTYEEFVFHVLEPSLSYSFGIQHDRRLKEVEPFDERESLHFVTQCIWPDRFKGREGKATIYPEPDLTNPKLLEEDHVRRKWIGYVEATKGRFDTVLWLPPQIGWRIGEAIASGLVRSMLTNTVVQPRGMHRAIHASFHGVEFDPVEYVG